MLYFEAVKGECIRHGSSMQARGAKASSNAAVQRCSRSNGEGNEAQNRIAVD